MHHALLARALIGLDKIADRRAGLPLHQCANAAGSAERAGERIGAWQLDQAAAKLAQLGVGRLRVVEDAGDVWVDRWRGPRPFDGDRHAEACEVRLAALPFEARHHLRIDAEVERLCRQVDGPGSGHAHERAVQMEIVRLRLALGDLEGRAERGEVCFLSLALLPSRQRS